MQPRINDFITKTCIPTLVNAVAQGKTTQCSLNISSKKRPGMPTWVIVEWAPPRHGCGYETDNLWAHSNDADLFAGTRGYSLNVAAADADGLIAQIVKYLGDELKDDERIEVLMLAMPVNGVQLPNLEGDSDSGELKVHPDYIGL